MRKTFGWLTKLCIAVLWIETLAAPVSLFAQQTFNQGASPLHRVGGVVYATAYNTWTGRIITGNSTTGTGTSITFLPLPLQDGTLLSTNVWAPPGFSGQTATNSPSGLGFTPIFINDGNAEVISTITAETVGTCPSGNLGIGQGMGPCVTITGTTVSTHGQDAIVQSGTAGLQEAINDLGSQAEFSNATYLSNAGGTVVIDALWNMAAVSLPSQTAAGIIGALTPFPYVYIRDDRASALTPWYTVQPSVLTAVATPTVRSATAGVTQVISGTGTSVGGVTATWTAVATYVCVTYVDILGGETPCSPTYNFTATASVNINFASPAASPGAVGWRAYAGVTSLNTAYLLPISSANCTLSTLEVMYPACAIGAAAQFATPTTATMLRPLAFITNIYGPVFQSHTTFAYQPATRPTTFQQHYGPFAATGSITGGNIGVLGTVALPQGFWNYIGRTVRVSGEITATTVNTATWTIDVNLGPVFTTGTPTVVCTILGLFPFTGAAYNGNFQCTMTVNALSASAGTIMTDGNWQACLTAGCAATIQGFGHTTETAAIGSLDTVDQTNLYVVLASATAATSAAQLLDLHVEVLN